METTEAICWICLLAFLLFAYRKAMQHNGYAEVDAIYSEADELYEQGKKKKALRRIDEGIELARKLGILDRQAVAALWNLRGCILENKGECREALRCYDGATLIMSKWCYRKATKEDRHDRALFSRNARQLRRELGF